MTPDLTIHVPHHLPACRPYLDACLRSILADIDGRYAQVVVVADTPEPPAGLPDGVTLVHRPDLDTVTKKGIFAMREFRSRWFLGASDDVVFGRRAILYMLEAAERLDDLALVAPDGNDENSTLCVRRTQPFPEATTCVCRGAPCACQQPGPDPALVERIMDYAPVAGDALAFAGLHLRYCAVLFPRKVIDRIGTHDPRFAGSFDDTDYLIRAHMADIPAVLCLRAWVHHFGSQTLSRTGTGFDENRVKCWAKWQHRPDLLACAAWASRP